MKKLIAFIAVLALAVCAFAGCTPKQDLILVAEKESAGEAVALNNPAFKDGYTYTAVDKMSKALMEVAAGTADIAIIDYITAIGSIGEGTDYENLKVSDMAFESEQEEYGIAFRKGSDATAKINEAIKTLKENGTLNTIAKKYKLENYVTATSEAAPFVQSETDSDWEYIKNKGKLIVGITYFTPMNYFDENGELVGFETEFAKAVGQLLGLEVQFQEINWDTKETELKAKNIDCIWNGMTITEDRATNMSISIPYMINKQVAVVKAN